MCTLGKPKASPKEASAAGRRDVHFGQAQKPARRAAPLAIEVRQEAKTLRTPGGVSPWVVWKHGPALAGSYGAQPLISCGHEVKHAVAH
ncbi:hypothetical protein Rhe02_18610 [Rhizocola hellebori]|uniref:Uncharacterized protein n=1 Tax=Rhizocola hellebori TaxID=1392758 RepID=A0A8J3Q4S7_9ACTN|nr:hypothetical protein Rhe02_18610 [Rhizocola hellebori]